MRKIQLKYHLLYAVFILLLCWCFILSCNSTPNSTPKSVSEKEDSTNNTDTSVELYNLADWNSVCWGEYIIKSNNPYWLHAVLNLNEYNNIARNVQVYQFGKHIGRKDILPTDYKYLLTSERSFGSEILLISSSGKSQLKTERFTHLNIYIESVFSHILLINGNKYYVISVLGSNTDGQVSVSFIYSTELQRFVRIKRIADLQGMLNHKDFVQKIDAYFSDYQYFGLDSIVGNYNEYYVSKDIIHIEGDEELVFSNIDYSLESKLYFVECDDCFPREGNTLYKNWSLPEMGISFSPIDKSYIIGKDIKDVFHGISEIGFRRMNTANTTSIELCAVTYWDICTKSTTGIMSLERFKLSGKDEVISVFRYDAIESSDFLVVISRTGNEYFTNIYTEQCGASGCCGLWEEFLLTENDDTVHLKCTNYGEFLDEFPDKLKNYGGYLLQ